MADEEIQEGAATDPAESDFCGKCGNPLEISGMCSGCSKSPDECNCPGIAA